MSRSFIPLGQRPPSGPNSGQDVNSARRFLAAQFQQAGFGDCEAEARDLVMAATGLTRAELITQGTVLMSPEAFDRIQDYSARRISGEPVDNILGWREFYGRRFKVSGDVLSPRQETEEVTAKALELIAAINAPHILDLGTGSGAIAVTLLSERPDATALAVDVSKAALGVARENAKAHNIMPRITLSQSDWFESVDGQFDLIISNPPYIDDIAMSDLPRDVAEFDPSIALRGGADGLDPYRLIAAQAKEYMKANGAIVFEIGFDQGESVIDILKRNGFKDTALYRDIFEQPRIVTARL